MQAMRRFTSNDRRQILKKEDEQNEGQANPDPLTDPRTNFEIVRLNTKVGNLTSHFNNLDASLNKKIEDLSKRLTELYDLVIERFSNQDTNETTELETPTPNPVLRLTKK